MVVGVAWLGRSLFLASDHVFPLGEGTLECSMLQIGVIEFSNPHLLTYIVVVGQVNILIKRNMC
jgi:hypothetical protein